MKLVLGLFYLLKNCQNIFCLCFYFVVHMLCFMYALLCLLDYLLLCVYIIFMYVYIYIYMFGFVFGLHFVVVCTFCNCLYFVVFL